MIHQEAGKLLIRGWNPIEDSTVTAFPDDPEDQQHKRIEAGKRGPQCLADRLQRRGSAEVQDVHAQSSVEALQTGTDRQEVRKIFGRRAAASTSSRRSTTTAMKQLLVRSEENLSLPGIILTRLEDGRSMHVAAARNLYHTFGL
ncbi:hypothetical protein BRADI_1g15950v3 [Brachypodium distachyon]|uniref:Uncharacterized protein n=1 Tax=Brachypodium distachyon TaxID=15368 RepID=I1GQQ3_BRADI|nr:hypothetical protein BRADI_1g15950v3 [Brachypodium distachyon]